MSAATFPTIIRNTYRKAFVRCPQSAAFLYEEGLAGAPSSIDLHAGAAFAKGIETTRRCYYANALKVEHAIEAGREALSYAYGDFPCPPGSNKTRAAMEGALYFYFEQWPLDAPDALVPVTMPDGSLGVEQHFSEPLPITHPTTGEPLRYEGRIDMLAADVDGDLWVVDEKTTGRLGDAWANQWYLDAGQTGYTWWARRALPQRSVVGVKIRGVGIYKTGYGKMEIPVLFQPWETKRWYEQMLRDVNEWRAMSVSGMYRHALDHACALYNSPCAFLPLCKQENPSALLAQMKAAAAKQAD